MNFEEHVGKATLEAAGIAVPAGRVCATAEQAAEAARELGPCAVKIQIPTGRRGKAGGIRLVENADAAASAAREMIGSEIAGHEVDRVLVEQQVPIDRELYAAVVNDPATKGPLMLVSSEGGMEIEDIVAEQPESLLRVPVDIRHGVDHAALRSTLERAFPADMLDALVTELGRLYGAYTRNDADLLEINPLVVKPDGALVALDCKLSLDDAAAGRQPDLAARARPEPMTALEAAGKEQGLRFIELDGDVGILANGAGLTMTTMDVVAHYGGKPANFLEIGGEAYTLGRDALRLVTGHPGIKSLVINFCGAFARTDVMTEGILAAWDELDPDIPTYFCVNGTGENEAIAMIEQKLGVTPTQVMDEAVEAAVRAAR